VLEHASSCESLQIIAPESLQPREVVGSLWLKAASNDGEETDMSDWLHNLPVLWMSLLVFGFIYLVTAAIYVAVSVFAVGERARSFKAISPGLLSPLGIIFALFVAFTASQVWTDTEKAKAEIDREASALRTVVILANAFPREAEAQLRGLIRRYIADAATQEWSMMANRTANLRAIPGVLAEALQATLALMPNSEGQKTAQREMATALETALDARRQRIIISQSQVNLLKWLCLFLQAVCALVAIAMVHSDNRLASIIALGIFATGVAASMLLILAHDRPFTGEISIRPDALLQVMPEIGS
jgi:energy-converting hydrogenase Eha subunit C